MEDLTKVFGTVEPVDNVPVTAEPKKASRMDAEIQKAFKATADVLESQNKDIFNEISTHSNDLIVVNTLSYTDGGGLIVDRNNITSQNQRPLVTVPEIVGYNVKNEGTEPIKYHTELWSKDENGVYVATPTELVLNPGETAPFTRKTLTMLASNIEYSFVLGNGKLIPRLDSNLEKMLNGTYFKFEDPELTVHDDSVKLAIADKIGDKWVIKPEFEATFGFLNNEKPKAPAAKRATSRKASRQALVSNYVRNLLNQSK